MKKENTLRGLKTICCGDAILKVWNSRQPGAEEEFYCRCCDKEIDITNVQDVTAT